MPCRLTALLALGTILPLGHGGPWGARTFQYHAAAFSWGGDLSSGPTRLFVDIPSGEFIFRQGDAAEEMFFIQDGQVEVTYGDRGSEAVLRVLQPGEFIGTASLLGELPRAASARARSDCRLLKLDRATFEEVVRERTDVALEMIRRLAHRLQEADKRLLAGSSASRKTDEDTTPNADAKLWGKARGAKLQEDVPSVGESVLGRLIFQPSGAEFLLVGEGEVGVGRGEADGQERVDLDLTPFDPQRTVSRHHVRLICSKEEIFLQEGSATTNGTYVNGERLSGVEPLRLSDGDRVRFGLVEAKFVAT